MAGLTQLYLVFVGKPSDDPLHVDYVPSVFAYRINASTQSVAQKTDRYNRSQRRIRRQQREDEEAAEDEAMAAEALVMMADTDSDFSTQTPTVSVKNSCTQITVLSNQMGVQACPKQMNRSAQTESVRP